MYQDLSAPTISMHIEVRIRKKEKYTNFESYRIFFVFNTTPFLIKVKCSQSLTLREERKLRVFENVVLRRIFGRRRDEVTGEWRRLHNAELNDLYSSPNTVWVIKWRRMRWAGHVERRLRRGGCIGSWWGNRREGDHWGDLGVDGWIILGRISRRWDVGIWTGLGWPRIETGGGRL